MTNFRDKTEPGHATMTRPHRELQAEQLDAVSGGGGPWGDASVVAGSVVSVQGAPGGPGGADGGADGVASMFGGPLHVHFKN